MAAVCDIDRELDAIDVDAEAGGCGFVVADRAERKAAARAKDEIDEGKRAGHQRQRHPIGDDVARGRRAHVEQGLDPFDAGHDEVTDGESEVPVPPPSALNWAKTRR